MNFDKRRREFEVIAQLTLYQKSALAYNLHHHPQLVQWLADTPVLTDQERSVLVIRESCTDKIFTAQPWLVATVTGPVSTCSYALSLELEREEGVGGGEEWPEGVSSPPHKSSSLKRTLK